MLALLIIDVQNDFCPGGRLEVADGDEIIPAINNLSANFDCVVQTQDWHPLDHSSFSSNHEGKNPYDIISMEYGEQILWPNHCVQDSKGAEFHPDLETNRTSLVVRKGFRSSIDSYSAFFENDHKTSTGLKGYLDELGVSTVFICGLALDFCVKWTALDARKCGFETYVIMDAVKGIDLDNSVQIAKKEMYQAKVEFINSEMLLPLLK